MSDEPVLYEKEGRVVTWTINRPDNRNSISARDMVERFESLAAQAAMDHDVSCIILTGAGTAFSSGGDVKRFAQYRDGEAPLESGAEAGAHEVPPVGAGADPGE